MPIAWRCGARVLVRRLQPWLYQWLDHRTLGGVGGRSVLNDEHVMVGQDLSKFFDSVHAEHLHLTLQHLRAPPGFTSLVIALKGVFSSLLIARPPRGQLASGNAWTS